MQPSEFSRVPSALRARPQWLVWRFERSDGDKKPRKVPYYAGGGRRVGKQGDEADRANLVTFDRAIQSACAGKYSGVGLAFLPGDGLIGIDLDNVIDPDTGEIQERAQKIIDDCASYTEYSPSGKGVHIYSFGETKSHKSNEIGVEMFCGRQFFTVTGKPYPGTVADVTPVSPAVTDRLHTMIDAARRTRLTVVTDRLPPAAGGLADRDRIESALAVVSPDVGHNDWIGVGMALYDALGESTGFQVWDYWSSKGSKYPGREALAVRWKSFGNRPPGTDALIFRLAITAGWRPPKAAGTPSASRRVADDRDNPPSPPEDGEPPASGGKGRRKRADKPVDWDRYNSLIERFVLIYGTDTVFDCAERMVMKVNALRLAYGSDYVKMWLAAEKRRLILPDQLVFDPGGAESEECINLFEGLPLEPEPGDCQPMLELLGHLCAESAASEGGVDAVTDWVLDWLAYPLQYPGAKMASALVFHGPQGAGKNLFFEAVASLYGRYSLVVGQDQLEDRFNDWASQKLFLIGDEVVARAELYHQKNKLKAFITGETIQINTKMLPLRTEANHANVVFLSNEHQPLALEPGDRRFLVVYTPPMRDDDLYTRVDVFLRGGGARRFLHYLLARQLGDFNRFTRPIMTRAKADLIELGLKPPERFVREWFRGYLPLPLQVCAAEQLYRAFRRWCQLTGERFPPTQIGFTKAVEKAVGAKLRYKIIKLDLSDRGKTSARMWVPDGCCAPPTVTEGRWAAEAMDEFERAIRDFVGEQHGVPA